MAISNLATGIRNSMCDAAVDAVDAVFFNGTAATEIYTTGFGTLLAELTFANPAFGAAATGVATANTITGDTSANATGTAAVCRIQDRDNNTCWEGTVGTSGADLNLNTVSITTGDAVDVTSFTATMPAAG